MKYARPPSRFPEHGSRSRTGARDRPLRAGGGRVGWVERRHVHAAFDDGERANTFAVCAGNIKREGTTARVANEMQRPRLEHLDERGDIGDVLPQGETAAFAIPALRIVVPQAYSDNPVLRGERVHHTGEIAKIRHGPVHEHDWLPRTLLQVGHVVAVDLDRLDSRRQLRGAYGNWHREGKRENPHGRQDTGPQHLVLPSENLAPGLKRPLSS
jgi:hypothetical protein